MSRGRRPHPHSAARPGPDPLVGKLFFSPRGVGEGGLGRPRPTAGSKVHVRYVAAHRAAPGAATAWARGPGEGCTAGQPQSEDAQSPCPPSSGATPQPFELKAPQATVPQSRGPACPWGGAFPSPPPQAEGPVPQIPLRCTRESRSARAARVLSSASLSWGAEPAAPSQPPGSAGGSCGVLQGGRMLRGAHTRRGPSGTGQGQGQEPEGPAGPARHRLTSFSPRVQPARSRS